MPKSQILLWIVMGACCLGLYIQIHANYVKKVPFNILTALRSNAQLSFDKLSGQNPYISKKKLKELLLEMEEKQLVNRVLDLHTYRFLDVYTSWLDSEKFFIMRALDNTKSKTLSLHKIANLTEMDMTNVERTLCGMEVMQMVVKDGKLFKPGPNAYCLRL